MSGGPDSICLVDILCLIKDDKDIDFDIVVAHVNHMIREEATSDEEFVRDYCLKKGILFFSRKVDVLSVARDNKIGTEEAGREERYKFFEEILKCENCTKIATAHTKCDNSETVLMNIIRGTGTSRIKGNTGS